MAVQLLKMYLFCIPRHSWPESAVCQWMKIGQPARLKFCAIDVVKTALVSSVAAGGAASQNEN